MKEETLKKTVKLCAYFLIFLIISLLGWSAETVFTYIINGKWTDRGFLYLPICPIYGFSVTAVYLLFGTLKEGGLLLKGAKKGIWRILIYFALVTVLPTLLELITGSFFLKAFGKRLWNYSHLPFNYKGIICPQFSFLWGIALSVGTLFIPPLKRLILKIPYPIIIALSVIFALLIAVDIPLSLLK